MNRLVSRLALVLLATTLAVGCGEKAADVKEAAQAALDGGDYPTAILEADKAVGLAGDDKPMVWQSQQITLQAPAQSGDGAHTATLPDAPAGAPAVRNRRTAKAIRNLLPVMFSIPFPPRGE